MAKPSVTEARPYLSRLRTCLVDNFSVEDNRLQVSRLYWRDSTDASGVLRVEFRIFGPQALVKEAADKVAEVTAVRFSHAALRSRTSKRVPEHKSMEAVVVKGWPPQQAAGARMHNEDAVIIEEDPDKWPKAVHRALKGSESLDVNRLASCIEVSLAQINLDDIGHLVKDQAAGD
eukprot:CAMPEP_0204351546 /NCGR_PEP_ID=MMETSP0469-20131031/31212_1 /ASSEMBLY_ACC=CAM_ASM_000384 /TAXON_ID=2969 /ORGANISM="Oxyrrhis marina" /LENGTH=174 /DNA_ID=CAMNT_0051338125 /DNA_START=115 /DNA_END=636 /DNA_ORIENTATION=-